MKAEIMSILSNDIMYKVGNTNEHLIFVYGKPFPKVVQIVQINDISVKVNLSNKAFALIPINNSIIFYFPNTKESE